LQETTMARSVVVSYRTCPQWQQPLYVLVAGMRGLP
jgi:hypothetical protein